MRSPTASAQLRERVQVLQLVLPEDAAFSHVTAALLWGLPLPRSIEHQEDLDVIGRTDRNRVRRRGCVGHRGVESRHTEVHVGVALVGLADTWCDLGEVAPRGLDVDDLVVAGDEVFRRAVSIEVLRSTLTARVRPRGARMLLQALDLARPGVRSPMETRMRVMSSRAGFPEPEVCAPVHDRGGGWLVEGDLVWRERRVVAEYQGEHHASRERRSADAARRELVGDEGWRVVEVFAEDVWSRPRRLSTLRRFAAAPGLDPTDPDDRLSAALLVGCPVEWLVEWAEHAVCRRAQTACPGHSTRWG